MPSAASNKITPITPLRSELKRLTRERLVTVAMHLFETEGFRATSVARIVQDAGTTAPTFYRHFKSKSDLMWIIQKELGAKVGEVLQSLDQIKRPTKAAIRAWIGEYAQMWQRAHRLCDAYWEATLTDRALAADIIPETIRAVELMTNTLAAEANPKARQKLQTRLVILSLVMDRVIYIADSSKATAMGEQVLDEFAQMLLQLLQDRPK